MPSSRHRHGQDKTVSGVNRIGDKSRLFSVVLNILETEQFRPVQRCERVCKQVLVANWKLGRDKTKLCSHHISRLDRTVSKLSVAPTILTCRHHSVHTAILSHLNAKIVIKSSEIIYLWYFLFHSFICNTWWKVTAETTNYGRGNEFHWRRRTVVFSSFVLVDLLPADDGIVDDCICWGHNRLLPAAAA